MNCDTISGTYFSQSGGIMLSTNFSDIAVITPTIEFPSGAQNLALWPVIACDQFTSEPEYWSETENLTEGVPSTAHLILPEVYLESLPAAAIDRKIASINEHMRSYIRDSVVESLPAGFILLDRTTSLHPSRSGLILAIDLEQYDFTPGNKSRIRATEGTVLSRIPPRVRIRKDAPLELPHIMLLIDDPAGLVIDTALRELRNTVPALYDVDLMQGGGHITGYFAPAESDVSSGIISGLRSLLSASGDGFLFAVGDGNHSLATAKAHWEAIRGCLTQEDRQNHPARYALVEVVNIHDKGLDFEPIHRVAFGLSVEAFYASAGRFFADQGFHFYTAEEFSRLLTPAPTVQVIPVLCGRERYVMVLDRPKHSLHVGSLQNFLDHLISAEATKVRVDYIHGEDSVENLAREGNTGFLLPAISKDSFFATISAEGVFPRKTFSMGEAFEKRYYMEAKRIVTEVVI